MRWFCCQAFSILVVTAFSAAIGGPSPPAAEPLPLQLETKLPLGDVKGRIDHMAVDLTRQHLFVAELENDSLGVVDLKKSTVLGRIPGLKEPQGVGYVTSTDALHVASAGDGSVRLFRGHDLIETGRIELGDDADNVRIDAAGKSAFVGYGHGGLATIDIDQNRRIADTELDGHPESFRLESGGSRIFVNIPDTRSVQVVDRRSGKVLAKWPMGRWRANFPMALDEATQRVIVVFRNPATLTAFSMKDGTAVARARTCGDSDDVFVDAKRHRVYVNCGEGYLNAFKADGGSFVRIAHISTVPGARTSLFVPELDRLFLGVRATAQEPAAIWIYRPVPQ